MLDGPIVRAHRHAAAQIVGADCRRSGAVGGMVDHQLHVSRIPKGDTEKVHLITDAHGHPLDFMLTPGQANENLITAVFIHLDPINR